ncbi:hypothetical protein FOPG_18441 [Fusarium oxysporum f. sp. conglutinans race 2 54008]|uniref:Uncharacterized protein n=4 Tax=Fusarium oxysporum TaxID=5507 RepID=A0A8H6LBI0_FUSOX|nr:hypothetical protein FOPG_18441 [Fusarium oxysporum f. sp. conglutinans race 2 54008]KAF6514172.1 hypothetical protein HZS61_006428 [Fusarium oxysporum f. sp. conglutinans]KAI8397374.1 hypothetical protein FOFC_20646 [Fusarium oxysporum]KAJ0135057.1 3-(3-hydroxy-phenyl)propionate/3-hydroxycinnamic acid hydroxylase [Fusarium oxysporum f. sp. albedinis]RKK10486.1 hypothetical protein BFJ65_g14484 [Fusarium oxysporum f. sp. cepae]RYC79897.1 hypothetical protein BFJ63_vAg17222 [Fusarium oxyspor
MSTVHDAIRKRVNMDDIINQSSDRQAALEKLRDELPLIFPPVEEPEEIILAKAALDNAVKEWQDSNPQEKESRHNTMLQCESHLEEVKRQNMPAFEEQHEKQIESFFYKLAEAFGPQAFAYCYEKWLYADNDRTTQHSTNSQESPTPPGTDSLGEPSTHTQS